MATVKGQPITPSQQAYANQIMSIGKSLGASATAIEAVIVEAIAESVLGDAMGWDSGNPKYGGLLAGDIATFGSLGGASSSAVTVAEINAAFRGGQGYYAGGAIGLAAHSIDLLQIAMTNSGSGTQFLAEPGAQNFWAEAKAIVAGLGGAAAAGGVAGLGGSGTSSNTTNTTSAANGFTVGDTSNPDEDYWTALNRLAQSRYWYCFSDGETLYVADGPDLMAQTPVATIDRVGDAARIISLSFVWDNAAFSFASTRKKHTAKVARKSRLAKVSSPVSGTLEYICNIDEIRAGDVIYMSGCGPGDGRWLVGDATRSIFSISSSLTIIPAISPIPEAQLAGVGSAANGAAASQPGSGTVMANLLSGAATINNLKLPYVWAGGHAQVGTPSIGSPGPGYDGHTIGYDCSGCVAAVLRAAGLWKASSVGSETDIISTLKSQGLIVPGKGSGSPECTLYDNPGVHIFMTLNGVAFGTSDGGGGVGPGGGGGGGGSWLAGGPGTSTSTAYHFPTAVLTKLAA